MINHIINGFKYEMEKKAFIGKMVGSLLKQPLKLIRRNKINTAMGGMAMYGGASRAGEATSAAKYIPGT